MCWVDKAHIEQANIASGQRLLAVCAAVDEWSLLSEECCLLLLHWVYGQRGGAVVAAEEHMRKIAMWRKLVQHSR